MQQRFLDLYTAVNKMQHVMAQASVELEREAIACADLQELADLAYVLRESYTLADETRKEIKRLEEVVAKIFMMLWACDATQDGAAVETRWCKVTPDVKKNVSVPPRKRDPQHYDAIMAMLGIPKEIAERGVMSVGWNEVSEYITEHYGAGQALPEGVDPNKVYTEYRLSVRKRESLPAALAGPLSQQARTVSEGEEKNDERDCNAGGDAGASATGGRDYPAVCRDDAQDASEVPF